MLALNEYANVDLELAQDMSRYYADPVGFVMYAFPWSSDRSIQVCKLKGI